MRDFVRNWELKRLFKMIEMTMTKKKMVPVLRFREFEGEWEREITENIINRISYPVDVIETELYQQIGIRSHGKGIFHKEFVAGKSLGNKRVFWVKEGMFIVNIVFAWEQAVAKTTKEEVGMIASHRFPMYEPLNNISCIDYILYFFLTKKGKYLLEMASPGGAGRNKTLGQGAFAKLKLNIPSIVEQQKIASFLTSIDEKIQQLTQKKALLEEYKKGVMQKIFKQEIRFKPDSREGSDEKGKKFPDWRLMKLREFLSTPVKVKPDKILRDKILTVKLHQKGVLKSSNTRSLSLGSTYFVRKAGQFIYGKQNLFNGAFGIVPKKFDGFITSGDLPALNIDTEVIDSQFLIHYLGRKSYYSRLESISIGTGSKRIHETVLLDVKIKLPTLQEQRRISQFLVSLDQKVGSVNAQIKEMNEFKKGLLQKMFV